MDKLIKCNNMTNKPLVSILTPCYNAGRFVSDTIKSVQEQTYCNWEMIIVDDCSTDNSKEIIDEYIKTDSRIQLIKLDRNTGSPAEPRNRAIMESKGDIVAFLDADDVWKPEKLECQIKYMQEHACSIVYSNGEIIDECSNYIRTIKKVERVDYKQLLKHDELSCSSVVVKKKLFEGCLFKKQLMEDYIFWLEVLRKTEEKAYNVNEVLYLYRLVGDSRSRDKKKIVKRQWEVLRHVENLNFFFALYCFFNYLWINLNKYYLSK